MFNAADVESLGVSNETYFTTNIGGGVRWTPTFFLLNRPMSGFS
jgi:hypothetical protein